MRCRRSWPMMSDEVTTITPTGVGDAAKCVKESTSKEPIPENAVTLSGVTIDPG